MTDLMTKEQKIELIKRLQEDQAALKAGHDFFATEIPEAISWIMYQKHWFKDRSSRIAVVEGTERETVLAICNHLIETGCMIPKTIKDKDGHYFHFIKLTDKILKCEV